MSVWASQRGNWEGQCTKMSTKSSNSIKKSDIWCLIYINRYIWPYPANIKRHFQDAKPLEKFEIRHFQRQLFSTLEIDKLGKCQDGALLVIESHRGRGPRLIIFTEEAGPPRYFVTVVLRRELWYKNRWLSVAQMSYWFIIGDRGLTKNQCRSDDDYYCDWNRFEVWWLKSPIFPLLCTTLITRFPTCTNLLPCWQSK